MIDRPKASEKKYAMECMLKQIAKNMMGRHGYSNLVVLMQNVRMVTSVEQKHRVDHVAIHPTANRLASSAKKVMLSARHVPLAAAGRGGVDEGVMVAVETVRVEVGVGSTTFGSMQSAVGYLKYEKYSIEYIR